MWKLIGSNRVWTYTARPNFWGVLTYFQMHNSNDNFKSNLNQYWYLKFESYAYIISESLHFC